MLRNDKKQDAQRLTLWQTRYAHNKRAYQKELDKMDRREALYEGTKAIKGAPGATKVQPAEHVRNVIGELIESQVSSVIPQPKVTALRPQDERRARLIEDLLRNELDRLPIAYNNDNEERTVPKQGGALSFVEWDSTQRTHTTSGALYLGQLHPKQFIPQAGVYTDIEDMDYCFLDIPQTKSYIKKRYGVDVADAMEERPEARGQDADVSAEDDLVTQHVAYYRNDKGGIGLFSWVGDQVLADMDDYQARRAFVCSKCGEKGDGVECRFCGSKKFTQSADDFETLTEDIVIPDPEDPDAPPKVIPAYTQSWAPTGADPAAAMLMGLQDVPTQETVMEPTKIPYYKPDVYPVVLRKNVSVFGRFLGGSDVDAIEDQQETIKKATTKMLEKLFKGGSFITAGKNTRLDTSDEELKILRLDSPAEASLIQVKNIQANVDGEFKLIADTYEEARQRIGITDSFQGRRDPTATSGVAKEFAAKQSAGRLESKRAMKEAYWSRVFKVMFQFILAYTDEPRTVVATDSQGHVKYEQFNRYDFLEQDAAGEWFWNDNFLFGVDPAASLSKDREALWQEARLNYSEGCYGPVGQTRTLVVFWTRMAKLHYPGAADMKTLMEDQLRQEQELAQYQAMAATAPQGLGGATVSPASVPAALPTASDTLGGGATV